jgi:hypothetical protein
MRTCPLLQANALKTKDLPTGDVGACTPACCTDGTACPLMADLAAVVLAWPQLPEHVRRAILTLVQASREPR